MNDNNGYSGADLLLAFLAGSVAGAAVALLTAPQSGSIPGCQRGGEEGVQRVLRRERLHVVRRIDVGRSAT